MPEAVDAPIFHQPVAMKAFSCFDDEGWVKGKGLDLCEVFLQRQLIAFHELGIDANDVAVLVAAVVDDKINATVFYIVLI
jgi:hypothetical protein